MREWRENKKKKVEQSGNAPGRHKYNHRTVTGDGTLIRGDSVFQISESLSSEGLEQRREIRRVGCASPRVPHFHTSTSTWGYLYLQNEGKELDSRINSSFH